MSVTPSKQQRSPTPDEAAGMALWNILKPLERAYWLTKVGAHGSVADAWAAFKRSQNNLNNRSP